ncbi:MAG: TspO/MBR family protein [Myxococcota bacterium]|nr:tryptophan-rich sensory protein [Myxococcales bacterium]
MRDAVSLVAFLALVGAAAAFGARFEPGAWYAALRKPPLTPPPVVFAPVWSVLYAAIAVAGWLAWRARPASHRALGLWALQLALNAAWSWLFFGLHAKGVALVDIVALLAAVVAAAVALHRVRALAGWLLAPYAAWVAFATYLNAGLWYLNS